MNYFILVVLYKTQISNSSTIISLEKSIDNISGSTILLWDNSPKAELRSSIEHYANKFDAHGVEFLYKHCPQNKGLAEVYNIVINQFVGSQEYFVLLDQDSNFCQGLFKKHRQALDTIPRFKLFVPKVRFKGHIVSPAKQYVVKAKYFKNLSSGPLRSKHVTAINSGMIISVKYLKDEFRGYDERLSLYGVDDYFMLNFSKQNKLLFVLDYEIHHDLSYSVFANDQKVFRDRFNDAQSAFTIVYGGGLKTLPVSFIVLLRRVYYTIKFKAKF